MYLTHLEIVKNLNERDWSEIWVLTLGPYSFNYVSLRKSLNISVSWMLSIYNVVLDSIPQCLSSIQVQSLLADSLRSLSCSKKKCLILGNVNEEQIKFENTTPTLKNVWMFPFLDLPWQFIHSTLILNLSLYI